MKRTLFVIALVIALIIWLKLGDSPGDSAHLDQRQARPAQAQERDKKPSPSKRTSQPAAPPLGARSAAIIAPEANDVPASNSSHKSKFPPGRPQPPPPGAVPYRLEGKLLVAFGDVVLGQPTAPDVPPAGFAHAPKLELWETKEIPFYISPQLENPERVLRALAYFNENSPLKFVALKQGDEDAIIFEPTEKNCRSYLGKVGGHQPIYLARECMESEILHETMHALGFIHEQSRTDRDSFIRVNWDRIQEDKKDQFEIVPEEFMEPVWGRPFDYKSVMIYTPSIFAKNQGDAAIESITNDPINPVREGLSPEDINRLFRVYGHLR